VADPKQAKSLQESIKLLLQETINRAATSSLADLRTTHSHRRRKKLASFMGTLLEEMTRAETTKAPSTTGNTSVLGNISPHHYETGSETPPSYNQLNYNDNLTRFFNSQPKTLTEKEASAIEGSSMYNEDCKMISQQALQCDTSSGSRFMRSGSPPFDTSNTATNSESGNGGSHSRSQNKTTSGTKDKEANEGGSGGESGENVYSGGTGTGTSGGVSAAANAQYKRIHTHTYRLSGSGGSGDNISGYNGGNPSTWDTYKSPLLTEQLLLAHNRGMEKKMIDSHMEGKKGDLKFLKNRLKTAKAAHHPAIKKAHHQVHKQLPGPVAPGVDPQASTIQLWPPFSVANTAVPMQVRPSQSVAGSMQPSTSMMFSTGPQMSSQQRSPTDPPIHHPNQPQPMYSNLIPAYYIPPHIASNQRATGGYFVSVPTIFSQQPLQLVQTIQGVYHPLESHSIGSNFGAAPQIMTAGQMPEARGVMPNHPGISGHQASRGDISPDRQNTMSIDSSIIEEAQRSCSHEKGNQNDRGPSKKAFKFQRPSSRTGSRATSVKAEPGSALEINLESNASVSASVQAVKMASPGFIASSSRASGGLQEQAIESTDSSMCSLLKSSDEFTPTTSNGSEDDEKESGPTRPTLPDPFWLANVDLTPQLTLSYQIKLKNLSEVLKRDHDFLKNMTQPNQVKEQLAQLYRELEDTGEAIKPLLEADSSPSCTSTSSSSAGEECEETFTKTQKQRQVKFERYAIIYGEDAPMPPSLKKPETTKEAKSSSNSTASSSGVNMNTSSKNESSKNSPEDSSSSSSSSIHSSKNSKNSSTIGGNGNSTSLGSSSAITVDSHSGDDENKGSGISGSSGTSKLDEGIGSKSTSTTDNDNRSGGDDEFSTKAKDTETPMELDDTSNEVDNSNKKDLDGTSSSTESDEKSDENKSDEK